MIRRVKLRSYIPIEEHRVKRKLCMIRRASSKTSRSCFHPSVVTIKLISSKERKAKVDTGSMETVTADRSLLDPKSFVMYSACNQPGIVLETASGDPLRIVGQGRIDGILDDVILSSPDVTETLIGVIKLKEEKGIGFDILPGKSINGVGSIFYREVSRVNGLIKYEVMGVADSEFEIDLDVDLSPTGIFFQKIDMHEVAAMVLQQRGMILPDASNRQQRKRGYC